MQLLVQVLKKAIFLSTGLFLIAWIFNFVLYINSNKKTIFKPRHYIKKIPIYLDYNLIYRLRTAGQFLGIILLTMAITFTIFSNMTPFGVTVNYAMEYNNKYNNKSISQLGPKNRVRSENINGQKLFKQFDDLIYFTTETPFRFDQATVRIYYKNSLPDQTIAIGFKDDDSWHYNTKPFDVPFLNSLNWIYNGYDLVLYQREQKYFSVDSFLEYPPKDGIIGTYNYDAKFENISQNTIPLYSPEKSETIINTPLRGKHIIYVYVENEPFRMKIQKQDLNWYTGPDTMVVKIYKGDEQVYEIEAEDDGIQDKSRNVLSTQVLDIKNPGNELPEKGVYRVEIDANDDTVIKSIASNLHKIVFANSIFPITNSSVYPTITATTSATTLYSNALTLSALTYHDKGKQDILVGNQVLGVKTLHTDTYLAPKDELTQILVPQNDVLLKGFMGYFAFTKDQFFLPTKYNIMPIASEDDTKLVDYILTEYHPTQHDGEWQFNEQTFDLKTAHVKDGKLNWLIQAPKLKQRKGEIIIKDIQITFHKRGWL